MPKTPESNELAEWERYFAMQCNNAAWTLVESDRTGPQAAEMLDAAHAAAYHWQRVGQELNGMRAKLLLAEVHALLHMGPSAWAYAQEVQAYFTGRETDDWELAFTHAIHAHAAFAAGEHEAYRSSYARAVEALDAIEDAESRAIVQRTFDQVPVPA